MDQPEKNDEQEENQEEDEEEIRQKGSYHQQLMQACKKGDLEHAKKCLDKKANINFKDNKKNWTPLIWASCKNHVQIVKLLLQRGAAEFYTSKQEENPKKCTLGIINNQIKQTPLQWACFKGNIQVVWLLLQKGLNWEDIDAFGNNCVHLAASGGSLKIFQTLMMLGVNVDGRNSRNHEVMDLATNKEIIALIKQHKETKNCSKSNKLFTDVDKKHWCCTCKKFFCSDNYKIEWIWESHESQEKERMDGKCIDCWSNIQKHEQRLQEVMKQYEYTPLTEKLNEIEGFNIEIDLKLLHDAQVLQEKLRTQNTIIDFMNSLKIVENYKTILKSVNIIQEMKDDSKNRKVDVDQEVLQRADKEIERLKAERNLRYQLDNIDLGNCNPEQVKNLENLVEIAKEKSVADNYLDDATKLKEKMARSIKTIDILKLFKEYPIHQENYDPVILDPKTKKPIDPITRKPVDIKLLLAPKKKKKGKKDNKMAIPDWATEISQMDQQIKKLEELLKDAIELQLHKEDIVACNEWIAKMKKESKYRKALEEEARIINDLKNASKKKK